MGFVWQNTTNKAAFPTLCKKNIAHVENRTNIVCTIMNRMVTRDDDS